MLIRLALLLIMIPLVELVLLLTIADVMGFKATLAVVIGTGLLGAWLLRRQGLRTLRNIRGDLRGGRIPSKDLLDGLLLVAAGVLLLTPGILTDLLGIALLIPVTRKIFRSWLIGYFQTRLRIISFPGGSEAPRKSSEVIDSYVIPQPKDSDRI